MAAAVYLCALVALFPAGTAIGWFAPDLAANVQNISGSVWSARGNARVNRLLLGTFDWHAQPQALIQGCFGGAIAFAGRGSAKAMFCADSTQLEQLHLQLPISSILPALSLPASIAAGRVVVDVQHLRIASTGLLDASGSVVWHDARAGIGTSADLGVVQVDVGSTATGLVLTVQNTGAGLDLELDLNVGLNSGGNFQVTGYVTPTQGSTLAGQFSVLGDQLADGRIAVRHTGRLY